MARARATNDVFCKCSTHPRSCTMKIFETIYKCVFDASAIFVGCYVVQTYWRIYQIYQHAEEQVARSRALWVDSRTVLALQLPFVRLSESMGNHDSNIVDADSVD